MLDRPLTLRASGLTLSNRLVKASMEESLATPTLDPSPGLERLHAAWSRGGAALQLSGHVLIDRHHLARPRDVVLDARSDPARFRAWAEASHAGGGLAFLQLNHAGRQTPRFINPRPKGPSSSKAVKQFGSFGRPVAMTTGEIADVVAGFGRAAAAAERAGFDGVEVHAAHGYLLSQFLSPLVNDRDDAYGGSLENRARLLLEVVREVRRATSKRFGLGVKINSADFQRGGFDAEDFRGVARMLDREAIDFIEVSGGNYESQVFLEADLPTSSAAREGFFLDFVRDVRREVEVAVLLTGGLRSRRGMEGALAEGADLIGMARPLALRADLPRALLAGEVDEAPRGPAPVRVRALRGLADVAWHWAQLARAAEGLPVDPGLSHARAIWRYLGADLSQSLGARFARTTPAAAPPAAPPQRAAATPRSEVDA